MPAVAVTAIVVGGGVVSVAFGLWVARVAGWLR